MQCVNIYAKNCDLHDFSSDMRSKHVDKAFEIAKQIVESKTHGQHVKFFNAINYSSKALKLLVYDIIPHITFRIVKLIPGILTVML